MNFIIRNIGWLLLLIFFVFMLFVISLNDKKENEVSYTGSQTQTGTEQKEHLDSLVEMIDDTVTETSTGVTEQVKEETKQGENEKKSEEKINNEKDNTETKEEKEGFFSKLFGKTSEDSKEKEGVVVISQDMGNLVKDTQENEIPTLTKQAIQKYAPEMLVSQAVEYPGISLETAPGKEFEVGVYSLKLNNKNFTETLAYMMQGDKIKQLQDENTRGCFEVEIVAAKNEKNIGKTGYVCKKYLQEISENQEIVKQSNAQEPSTKIGDIITVEKKITLQNGIVLEPGDRIDQMTTSDTNECFLAHILESSTIPSIVPVGRICLRDIKK